jgi:hypothetical protein
LLANKKKKRFPATPKAHRGRLGELEEKKVSCNAKGTCVGGGGVVGSTVVSKVGWLAATTASFTFVA